MRGQSLFTKMRRDTDYQVRPARNDDWLAIERLLAHGDHYYLALEWWAVQDWLGSPTLLLAIDPHEHLVGLMLAVTGDGPVGWLRAVAAATDDCLRPLLAASAQAVLAQGGTGLAYLGDEGWMLARLRPAGFQRVNRVVTLQCRGTWPQHHGTPGLKIRAATPSDLGAILAVDHAAFEPMWWYSREVLRRALRQTLCFYVAHVENDCAGYQFSTLRHRHGHIVRLATHPHWQRQGIGGRLLNETLLALERAGAEQLTVNTQENNLASLQLYQRFNFDRVGKPWSVWFKSLEK